MSNTITVDRIINGTKVSDGDGVQLTRYIGTAEIDNLDPFLLLDVFESYQAEDYIGGFPSHPHRGFETVTYMLAGKMRHEDSIGTSGIIEAGGVQWMRAGSGIIHSEMPEQEDGLLSGIQLWINLPASHKYDEPSYQEVPEHQIPDEIRQAGSSLKVIAGTTKHHTQGAIDNLLTEPVYWDVHLEQGVDFSDQIPEQHHAFIYLIQGKLNIAGTVVSDGQLALLSNGTELELQAETDSRFLLLAAKPLNEPIARGGPFVMNTKEEIAQAHLDYSNGVLIHV